MAIPGYYSLLQRGSSGPDVALVQTWLNGVRDACTWYDALKADGKFGASTQRAVQEFQLKNKMNMDGNTLLLLLHCGMQILNVRGAVIRTHCMQRK